MGIPDLQGVYAITPTPLTGEGEVDEAGVKSLIDHCRESGLHGAVVLGSNGEFPYFRFEEKERIIRAAGAAARGLPLVAGASAAGTDESMALARVAKDAGCVAVMASLPLYFQLDFAAVKRFYADLAQEGGLPVIFYYWPETNGLTLSPAEIAEIAAIDGVVGAKLSVMNRSFIKRVINLTRTQLWAVFPGSAFLLRYGMKRGAAGVFCPLPLIAPEECLATYEAMENGELDKADELQDHLLGALPIFSGLDTDVTVAATLFKALSRRPYTGPGDRPAFTVALVKEAMRLQGRPITSTVRRPCPRLTHEQADLVAKTLKAQGWL